MSKLSNTKGGNFERRIARDLRAWLGPEWIVERRPPGVKGRDLMVNGGPFVFPFAMECKHHKAFAYEQLWKGTGPFAGWWGQALEQAIAVQLQPLLVFRGNNGPILAALTPHAIARIISASPSLRPLMAMPSGVRVVSWPVLQELESSALAELSQ